MCARKGGPRGDPQICVASNSLGILSLHTAQGGHGWLASGSPPPGDSEPGAPLSLGPAIPQGLLVTCLQLAEGRKAWRQRISFLLPWLSSGALLPSYW